MCKTPLVGDTVYDDADENALRLRKRGLFLCSNQIIVEHPYYNTPAGHAEWIAMKNNRKNIVDGMQLHEDDSTGVVMVKARIKLPDKFEKFLEHENNRVDKFLS